MIHIVTLQKIEALDAVYGDTNKKSKIFLVFTNYS